MRGIDVQGNVLLLQFLDSIGNTLEVPGRRNHALRGGQGVGDRISE